MPHCNATTGKGLQVFYDDGKGKYTGFCFSCSAKGLDAYVENPYNGEQEPEPPKKKTKEEIDAEIREIKELGTPEFTYRGIPKEYFKRSKVRLAFSEYDGITPNSLSYPYSLNGNLKGYKTILMDKKIMWSVGDIKGADLFNWELAKKKGTKRLYVTEGEIDCLSLEYMLDHMFGQNGKYRHAVVSVPHGAGSAAPTLGRMRKEIESLFEEIVLVFDNDDAGIAAVKEVQKVLPNILEAPHSSGIKDANQALESGDYGSFIDFVKWKARKPPIEGVVTVSQAMERGVIKPEMGLSYPLERVSAVMYGQRFGEATGIAGGIGCGKTVLAHEFSAHNMNFHKEPCFVSLLEEDNIKTCWNIAAKIDSIPYNRPEVFEANKERYYETMKSLEDKLFMWNSQANSSYRFDLLEIINAIRFNNAEYGCRFAYIDNMTRITDMMSTADANEFINRYSSEIANLASELNIHISVFSHLNTPKFGRTHEEGGEVLPAQLTGSRGVIRSFSNIIGFERNKLSETKNNSYISIVKNRDYGDEQKIKTQYNPSTGRLIEYEWEGENLW